MIKIRTHKIYKKLSFFIIIALFGVGCINVGNCYEDTEYLFYGDNVYYGVDMQEGYKLNWSFETYFEQFETRVIVVGDFGNEILSDGLTLDSGVWTAPENGTYWLTFINLDIYLQRSGFIDISFEVKVGFIPDIILIDDTDPSINWSTTASTHTWCTGNGTSNNPYIIENIVLNGQQAKGGFYISNSIVPFIIKNCTVHNSTETGINLLNVENGLLDSNNCSNNKDGILLVNSNFTTIKSNELNENYYMKSSSDCGGRGLSLENSCHNNIVNNTIHNTGIFGSGTGIRLLTNSNNNTIENNELIDNPVNMYIFDCKFNTISENYIFSTSQGLRLYYSDNNSILNNSIIDNYKGVSLQQSNNNTILTNLFHMNRWFGLGLDECFDNLIYNNNFTENINQQSMTPLNAEDKRGSNTWDNGSIGNYWDDYNGLDIDDDKIGDTPYFISGSSNSKDNYPIWDDGIDPPDITISSPENSEAFGLIAPSFNITVTDENPINTTWYTIDEGLTNYTFTETTGIINQSAWDLKDYGSFNLTFYANDTAGSTSFMSVTIWKDLNTPLITVNAPIPNQLCGIVAPEFSLAIDEPNLHKKWYSLNGGKNITFTTETQINQAEWDKYGNETIQIRFYANDTVGNMNFTDVLVSKDNVEPIIVINAPILEQKFGVDAPEFNITIIEETAIQCWYTLNNGDKYYFTEMTEMVNQNAWNSLTSGVITITFYAQDEAGNIGYSTIIITKAIPPKESTLTPDLIPSFNLLIIIGIIGLISGISVIVIKKRIFGVD